MIIIKSKNELLNFLRDNPNDYAFVPTMGALHSGHLSLLDTAKKYSKHIIVSIFVNPTQFSVNEDFSKYPRTIENDIALLENAGVKIVYIPTVECIYPVQSKLWLDIPSLTNVLCGKSRPHFFNGVMTVLLKFFLQINPKFVILGEKDYQQFLVVREMVNSIGLNIQVVPSPIIRNANGLALSSRNVYLKSLERAEEINKILYTMARGLRNNHNFEDILSNTKTMLLNNIDEIDYLEVRNNEDLELYCNGRKVMDCRIFFAGKVDGVRLIDNVAINF